MTSLLHRKTVSLEALHPDHRLKPTLSWWHLIPLGVGAIVGTGIYTLIGVGANLAGPAVLLSFLIAGGVCACAALAYAEVAILAGLAPLDQIASLANAGTLAAFTAVSACLLVLRRRSPDSPRIYRTPLAWLVGPLAIAGCLYLFWNLPVKTRLFFLAWNIVGLVCYILWRRFRPKPPTA